MKKIIILNGPNLNLLGEREKSQYGSFTLEDIENNCNEFANNNDLKLSMYQSNIEGELIEKIQQSRNEQDGLIIELHISNIYNREDFRHKSLISKVANGVICGFGISGYILALRAMKKYLNK